MGTDIHMAVEIRKNGKWELFNEKVFPNPYFGLLKNEPKFTNVPYDNRNYDLFAILAGVRNGRGFAGCITGERFNPISKPKGYPEDMCEELKRDISEDFDFDDNFDFETHQYKRPHLSNEHSGSYLSLKELLEYDWNQLHRSCGFVSAREYEASIYKGKNPNSWCGGISGANIVKVSEKEMRDIIEGRYPVNENLSYYTFCTFFPQTYAEEAGSFYDEVIPILKTLIPEGGTEEDVRIVFDFDS